MGSTMRAVLTAAALLCQLCSVKAFVPSSYSPFQSTKKQGTKCYALIEESTNELTYTRRRAWEQTSQIFGAVFLATTPALAKDPLDDDKQKLLAGYKRLNYLLDNWEKETTDCKTKTQYSSASSPCERTPLNVQYYLGYRSTEDPLFRADKTMRRLETLVPPGSEVDYLDAMEKFREKAEEGSGMAYVSSWGEANPGGGKDRVEYFVERAKANVVDARDSLGVILKILNLID